MEIAEEIIAYVTTADDTKNVIGARIYPFQLPQQPVMPTVTYLQISDSPEYDLGGETNLQHPRFQFDCYGGSYGDAKATAKALKSALGKWNSVNSSFNAIRDNEVDFFDSDRNLYKISVDYIIWRK